MDLIHVHIEKIKLNLDEKVKKMTDKLTKLDHQVNEKVDKEEFTNFEFENNKRFTAIHEERKKMANKEETMKALTFIDDKVNYLCSSI